MADFINSVDVLGDDALADSIIDRSITEYRDNEITLVGEDGLSECAKLTIVDIPTVTSIANRGFAGCKELVALILRNNVVVTLQSQYVFVNSKIASGTGYIYVPRALVDSYKVATNWSKLAAQFRALEDYTIDGTITGELDPEKI